MRERIAALGKAALESEGEGDRQGALALRLKAALLGQSLGDRAAMGDLLVDCGRSFASMGEYLEALRYLERARDLARDLDAEELKGEVYRGYGALYKARGKFDEAAVCFDRALERLEYSSRHESALQALVDLSEIYLGASRTAEAGALLARAKALPPSADPSVVVRLEINVGRLALLGGDRASAVASYELAARAAERANRPHEREVVALGLAGLYLQEGRIHEAAAKLREALALSIVAFSREAGRPLERARFSTMSQRLSELDMALEGAGGAHDERRQVDQAVLLYNAHPLVLTHEVPPYGTVRATVGANAEDSPGPDVPVARAEIAWGTNPPNPK